MKNKSDIVYVIGGCTPDGGRYITACRNHLALGMYKAYIQRGGACYKLYPMSGQRYLPPAGVTPFTVPVYDVTRDYNCY